MSHSNFKTDSSNIGLLVEFLNSAAGLRLKMHDSSALFLLQEIDKRNFKIPLTEIAEILTRKDSDNKSFLQVNFVNNKKILLTDSLIGFKPESTLGLDMAKIPKVVTTPDLKSVADAIEESLSLDSSSHEIEILKKVYASILNGAEAVGFELIQEKQWIERLMASRIIASA